jgi:hypothetical protein
MMVREVPRRPELDLGEFSEDELAYLAMQGGGFDWLADEPDLYSDNDLKERFAWTNARLKTALDLL